jgi:DNA-binding transcriptional regulator YiaG
METRHTPTTTGSEAAVSQVLPEDYRGLVTPAVLKQLRHELGLSARGLAKLLGVGVATVSTWEHRKDPFTKQSAALIRECIRSTYSRRVQMPVQGSDICMAVVVQESPNLTNLMKQVLRVEEELAKLHSLIAAL